MNMHEFLAERRLDPEGKKFAERGEWDGKLTSMQETVVTSASFWDQNKNIVIHGPTSSGKTLLAEIAALHQIQEEGKNVLFLVPLRVLVTSQCRQLQRDFEQITKTDGKPLNIFESSADYQDHDAEILAGNYDIAVIVYEKFFAMLHNSPNRMLDCCGLIVVDELQMLSSDDRGPKMEFSIMRILEAQREMRARGQSIRLIGMTTSESGVENVCRWLNAENLGNDVRPVSLKQHFVSCRLSTTVRLGEVWSQYIPGGTEHAPEEQEPPFQLEIAAAAEEKGKDKSTEKNRCFFALLKRWMERPNEEDAKAKILIFSSAKRSVRFLANELRKKYPRFASPNPDNETDRKKLQSAMNDALNEFGDEDDISNLSALIQHGIAFHHSGLPSTVREAIENDFRSKSGQIQIIVCTETLMIGVNLPADVVILYDNTVFRGEPLPLLLTLQEYKNFIGRAGRLGMSNGGESYMLTEHLHQDFATYTSSQKTEIVSPFKKSSPREIAPYFLSWIGNSRDAQERILYGLEQGFYCNQEQQESENIENFAKKILKELQKLGKKNTDGSTLRLVEEIDMGLETAWTLTTLGGYLAPYALTLNTDAVLLNYVICHRDTLHMEQLRLEMTRDKEPLPSAALLELLYTICKCTEVEKNPVLKLPTKEDQIRELGRGLKKYLHKVYPNRPQSHTDQKSLGQIAYMESVLENREALAAMRAVILALWMAGCPIRFIRRYTNFNVSINTSDVERLSESVAYLMEAVSNCQKALEMDEADIGGMYALSTSMKYGVPRPLVPLANLHVRKVTRPFLLKIGELAKAGGKMPVEYILASTEKSYESLQKALREREYTNNYKQQLENRTLEIPDKLNSLLTVLGGFDCSINADATVVYNRLKEFFEELRLIEKDPTDSGIQVHDEEAGLQIQFSCNGGGIRQIYFKTLRPVSDEDKQWTESVLEFRDKVHEEAVKAGIQHTHSVTVLCGEPPAGAENLPADELVISSEMLGVLLLACLLENLDMTNDLICRVLSDLQGNFILGGSGFFNGYGQLWELVKGYSLPPVLPHDKHLQLFYYPGLFDSKRGVLANQAAYIEFPWGYEESAGGHRRAAFYHPAMQYSRQGKVTLQHCNIICCNDEDAEQVNTLLSTAGAIYVKEPQTGMDELLREFSERLTKEQNPCTYDVGISFRGIYNTQMQTLREQLEQRGKTVLCMETDKFEREMDSTDLHESLREHFSQCRHIIVCDTADYDQSSYTLVEYNVIVDKLTYALQNCERIPVYLVSIPGVKRSRKLSNFFRYGFTNTYDEKAVDTLIDRLINQMAEADQSNQDTASSR